jgi:hypothetical protein
VDQDIKCLAQVLVVFWQEKGGGRIPGEIITILKRPFFYHPNQQISTLNAEIT